MEARIESMGYEVGYRLVERTCQRRWMGGDQLEAIKFVCKDLWSEVSYSWFLVSVVNWSLLGMWYRVTLFKTLAERSLLPGILLLLTHTRDYEHCCAVKHSSTQQNIVFHAPCLIVRSG